MGKRRVRVAIIGLGHNGRQHAAAHAASPLSEVAALCDRDGDRLTSLGSQLGVRRLCQEAKEIFADPAIEAVSIHTPDGYHKELFLQALEAGKHILIEKPLANTENDVVEMVKAADEHGSRLKIQVGYILRFNPVFEAIHRLIRSQEIGRVFYLEADYVHNLLYKKREQDPATGRNWFLDDQIPMVSGGSHCVDLLRWIKGMNPTSVFSYGNHFAFPEMANDDCMVSMFRFEDGSVAKVAALWGPQCPRPSFYNLRVYGTNGTIEKDKLCVGSNSPGEALVFKPIDSRRIDGHPFDPEIEDWLTAIVEDGEVRTSLRDGANSTMAALMAVKAAREGRETPIPVF